MEHSTYLTVFHSERSKNNAKANLFGIKKDVRERESVQCRAMKIILNHCFPTSEPLSHIDRCPKAVRPVIIYDFDYDC